MLHARGTMLEDDQISARGKLVLVNSCSVPKRNCDENTELLLFALYLLNSLL